MTDERDLRGTLWSCSKTDDVLFVIRDRGRLVDVIVYESGRYQSLLGRRVYSLSDFPVDVIKRNYIMLAGAHARMRGDQ